MTVIINSCNLNLYLQECCLNKRLEAHEMYEQNVILK